MPTHEWSGPNTHVAVIGAGAIGCLVAAYLSARGIAVSLVVRPECVDSLRATGVRVTGVRGAMHLAVDVVSELRRRPDLVIVCVKTTDIVPALEAHRDMLQASSVVTVQNGVRSDAVVASYVLRENIVSSIVMFVATYVEPGRVVHNAEGSWVLGGAWGGRSSQRAAAVSSLLETSFSTAVVDNLRGMKFLKVFLNANNCLAAILNQSFQEAFADVGVARIAAAIWREGFEILSSLGVELASLPGFSVEKLMGILRLPLAESANVLSGTMTKLSAHPVYGSILQSIRRGRASEIDAINGEFVTLARENGMDAPLNAALVQMVHDAERGVFLSQQELIRRTSHLVG